MVFQCAVCFIYPQGAIIIHEVYEEGAASKDGRLWAGDQILEVRWFLCHFYCHLLARHLLFVCC